MGVTSLTRGRRGWVYAAIVGVGLLLGLCAGLVTYWSLGAERIRQYSVDVAVQEDGTALVRETIDYDFGSNQKHGIFRDFPGYEFAGFQAGDDVVSDVRVWSASAPDDVDLAYSDRASIRVGSQYSTVSGEHRYVIQYKITGATSGDRLAFDAVGTGWQVPIDSADIHLTAPYRLRDVKCFRGHESSTNRCESLNTAGDAVTAHVEDLDAGQGVTIDGTSAGAVSGPIRTGFSSAPELTASRPFFRTVWLVVGFGSLGFVLGAIVVVLWTHRVGRDRAWAGGGIDAVFGGPDLPDAPIADTTAERQVTMQFEPPRDLTPAQGGVLLAENVEERHQVAWLIQQALDGWLEVENDGKRLRWTGEDRKAAPAPLRKMFNNRAKLSLAKYDKSFAAGFRMVGEDLREWRSTCDLWDHAAESRNRAYARGVVALGGVALVVGLILLIAASSPAPLAAYLGAGVSAFFVGAGTTTLLSRREMPVRTPRGFAYRQLVEGFRRFFAASEGRHAREAADRGELRLYSAWAVALGELDHWNAAMRSAELPPETPGVADLPTYVLLTSTVHTATSPPSSSSGSGLSSGSSYSGGGFSGGGGVGGGGGGGGGGSW
jgi:uncharacterized membrane protein YgcG